MIKRIILLIISITWWHGKSSRPYFYASAAFGCKNNLNILLLEVFGHFFDVSFENN